MIVQRLRDIQNRFGCLPDEELKALAREIGVPLYRIEDVSSFFPAFRLERTHPAGLEVRVCRDYTCHLRGAAQLLAPDGLPQLTVECSADLLRAAQEHAVREQGSGTHPDVSADRCRVMIEGVSCLGRCDRAPAVWVERHSLPMPADEHAWVYAPTPGETFAAFRDRLVRIVRELAAGCPRPEPDTDAAYRPNTNRADGPAADPRGEYTSPPRPATAADHPPPEVPRWEIDPYGWDALPRDYRAVRKVAEFLKGRLASGLSPVPEVPAGVPEADLDRFIEAEYPPLAEMRAAGLLGMGGAGMPAYQKWRDVWREEKDERKPDKYVVCNGDESEPGTFKDRELLLRTPHLVVEGVILAGLMTGAAAGYVYIRHEYQEQIHAVRAEIERAARLGACGPDVFGTGIAFPVEVFESPGGYICGEQSALLEAMEDRRAQPRNRPPELLTNGLRDMPTVVNNVETLAWAPFIQLRGGAAYAASGWRIPGRPDGPGFAGRRLFSVSGDVVRPGVYEVPVGLPFGELLEDARYCDGVVGGKPLKAVAPSGPSGGLMPARIPVRIPGPDEYEKWLAGAVAKLRSDVDREIMTWFVRTNLPPGSTHLDIRAVLLDLNFFRNLNLVFRLPVEAMLGAGIGVYAEGADVLDHAVNFTRFYRNESCGKCVPCRLGSQKLFQIGTALLARRATGDLTRDEVFGTKKDDPACVAADVRALNDALQQTSICGLGYVAPIPLNAALEYFPGDVVPPRGS
ncbi:MAG: Respiratory-chain dehydrogenase domain 51 kDa subunit [Gemmataceae bacterium]|nr:Respiratory-chain dehydrogenase domain 51 kDa subunit [Gemmataceae bacterium]